MDSPTASGTQLKSSTYPENSERTVQCPTPIASSYSGVNPYGRPIQEILEKANKVRVEQRRLIATRGAENKLTSSSDNIHTSSRADGNALAIDIESAKSQGDSYSLSNAPSSSILATPPTSTTEITSGDTSKKVPQTTHPRPGLRRQIKLPPLDVDALRRERQYSGPYSANPLLSSKRDHETMRSEPISVDKPAPPVQSQSAKSVLPPIVPAPFVSHKLSHLQVPFSATTLPLPTIPPSLAQQPSSALTPRENNHEGPRASSQAPERASSWSETSYGRRNPETGSTHTAFAKSVEHVDKKAKFIDLCEQIWDLINEK